MSLSLSLRPSRALSDREEEHSHCHWTGFNSLLHRLEEEHLITRSFVDGSLLQGRVGKLSTASKNGHSDGRDHGAAAHTGYPLAAPHLIVDEPVCGVGRAALDHTGREKGSRRLILMMLRNVSVAAFKSFAAYEGHDVSAYPFGLALVQHRGRVEEDLLLPVGAQHRGLLHDVDDVWIHPGHQGGFHHRPVLRVHVDIADVAAASGPHEACHDKHSIKLNLKKNNMASKSVKSLLEQNSGLKG